MTDISTTELKCWLEIDDEAKAYYLRFDSEPDVSVAVDYTLDVIPGLLIDIKDGRLFGIEILDERLVPDFRDRAAEWLGDYMARAKPDPAKAEQAKRDAEFYKSVRIDC